MDLCGFARGRGRSLHTDNLRKDNITHKLSEAWAVEYNKHLIRPKFYKGTRLEAEAETSSIKLSYNGMSFPGFFFTVAGHQKSMRWPFPRCVLEHRILFWS